MTNEAAPEANKLHLFTCPHCSHQVTIQNTRETVSRRWISCGNCGRPFRIDSSDWFSKA